MENNLENIISFNISQLDILYERLTMYPEVQEDIQNLIHKLQQI